MDAKETLRIEILPDSELAGVAGGTLFFNQGGKTFRFIGENSDQDCGHAYLCPSCHPLIFSP